MSSRYDLVCSGTTTRVELPSVPQVGAFVQAAGVEYEVVRIVFRDGQRTLLEATTKAPKSAPAKKVAPKKEAEEDVKPKSTWRK